ncbi:uncharacterized protein BCR38DRAFT_346638 [Pseudomassariella vexata]|uniref:TIGR02453 family protein n=1 Tax=Pseudomassariella vexata TaxID=1141098 RepID=A0A1Y2DU34_9PEZI|nr:uncharacterized protein BCR38DRAFT_346638 [Pseudomassariella vexata]ORY62664.1 hypothetical protein BCR38DRAFT_346638 [Pseudomassariella vexata]
MPPKKRAQAKPTPQSGGRRRSQRVSFTGKKSTYFEDDVDESDASLPPRKAAKPNTKKRANNDLDEEHQFVDEEVSEDDQGEGSDDAEDSVEPPPRKRGRPAKAAKVTKAAKETPKKRAKVESEDEDEDDWDDDAPRVTFTKLPELRDTGGIDYEDDRLHPNTMLFLKELKANNKRLWLKLRDPEYRRSLKDWETFVETLTEKITEADETIPELPLKDVIFRIYRDIRFSKDPTPYKPHYSAAWSRTGRKGPYACYYVHCEPGSCFVGGGLWHPDKDALAKLRASIDERPHRIRRVLMNPQFRNTFLPKAKNTETSVLATFAESNKENALKTKPQGFNPDHRDIELLKLRNYTVGVKIKDSDLTSDDAQDKIMVIINHMVEYVTFLNSVVMPDPNEESDSDDQDEDEAETQDGTTEE